MRMGILLKAPLLRYSLDPEASTLAPMQRPTLAQRRDVGKGHHQAFGQGHRAIGAPVVEENDTPEQPTRLLAQLPEARPLAQDRERNRDAAAPARSVALSLSSWSRQSPLAVIPISLLTNAKEKIGERAF
jgi:hypothetical protein